MRKKQSGEEALKSRLNALAMVSAPGTDLRPQINEATAENVLHTDLGYFSDGAEIDYNLDEPTRDRLIAHGRQDAAHAVLIASDTSNEIAKLQRQLRNTQIAVIIFGVMTVILLVFRHLG
jgi:hypothetical protein